ncbi:MAG: PEP-CTERM sorting domain-containing protein [Gammaproteobacteria bacterium]
MLKLIGRLVVLACAGLAGAAHASVIFYTDRTSFETALSSYTLIDFEGIVADIGTTVNPSTLVEVIGGVTFSVSSGAIAVSGKNGQFMQDAPFNSAILFSNNSTPITADLTSAGPGFTAVGAFFGNIHDAGDTAVLTLLGSNGILDIRTIVAADMGAGTPSNYFGWTVFGDIITGVKYDLIGGFVNTGDFDGIDDFVFGIASATPAPAPATIALFGLGLAGLGWSRRKAA